VYAVPEQAGAPPPLAGVRVLDFTHVLAGPFCTRLLADLGAEVVRVESSQHPDAPWRSALDRDVSYLVVNRNKQSAAINLKTEQGRDLAARMAAAADVLTENFSAGVMARLGLDYARLSGLNPRLIYVSMSGYEHAGPRRDWTSMNTNLQAYSGLMTVTGRPGEPPTAISNFWMDYVGGLHAAFAIVEALAQRSAGGAGRRIDLSQFECGVSTLGPLLLSITGHPGREPSVLGGHIACAATGLYVGLATAAGLLAAHLSGLGQTVEVSVAQCLESWMEQPMVGYLTAGAVAERRGDRGAITAVSGGFECQDGYWMVSVPHGPEDGAQRCHVPASPVATPLELVEDPQLVARGFQTPMRHPLLGSILFPRGAIATPTEREVGPAPLLGQHTADILADLGYSVVERRALFESSVV
jgi:crotonobetainyl-CoA:carnitine CoA-transferase CaiB-like acyl-CoA transferase